MLDLNNRVIMISGANRGIGQATAENLLDAGCRLNLGVRNPDQVFEKLLLSDRVLVGQYDAADPDGALEWVGQIMKHFNQLDGIVNNAGIYRAVSIEECDEEDLDAMWEVNVKGPWRLLLSQPNHATINELHVNCRFEPEY